MIIILYKGEIISFRDMLESRVGYILAEKLPYIKNDKDIPERGIFNEDYFEGDADYEIIIRKKRI